MASFSYRLLLVLLLATVAIAGAVKHHHRGFNTWGPRKGGKNGTFDYVVVGGGTAGLTIAARLAEDASRTVAVVEAGGFYEQDVGNLSVVPGYCTSFSGMDPTDVNPLIDWGFVTQPQLGVDNRRLHYTRGKTLGGTSARNYMYYHRPSVGALDKWADAVSDDGYRFKNLLPFYQKSVHYTPPVVLSANSTNNQDPDAWSVTGGPLQVSHGNYVDPFGTWVQPAAKNLGMANINGFQSGKLLGSAYLPFTIDPEKSQRSSSESSFLRSLPRRARLQVYHHALAEKVILDKRNTAIGVVVSSNGSTFTLNARKEVILSAGSFQSPQLLMLSGIGPAATLAKYHIPLRIDLPGVGSNLQDHIWFGTQYRVLVPTASAGINDASSLALSRQAYDNSASGALTIPTTGFLAWEKVPDSLRKNLSQQTRDALDTSITSDWPELEHIPVAAALGFQRNYQKEDPMDGYNYATVASLLAAPFSRGSVTISSANPVDPPVIDPNYLSHPADVELVIVALRRQRDFWAQMKGVTISDEILPGPAVNSDEDILKYVKNSLAIAPHASGTCRMGKRRDSQSVVDSVGRVYGAKGLRVVDASIFPLLPPGHPQSTVYAVAEKIADDILRGRGRW
ncbi:MAG: hypothetical protein Q9209_006472 [Squamulea sp. 1 TL-2023]